MGSRRFSYIVACALMAFATPALSIPQYAIVDLGIGYAQGINDAGQIAAGIRVSDGTYRAFLIQGSLRTDLGTLGGSESYGVEVNSSGHVAGSADVSTDDYQRACLWRDGTATNLGLLTGRHSAARAINDSDLVVGYSETNLQGSMGTNRAIHAILWEDGTLYDLGTLPEGPDSYAEDINNLGTAVGHSQGPGGNHHTVIWQNRVIQDLGSMGGICSTGRGINNLGHIVGAYQTYGGTNPWHAYRYQSGQVTDLGTIGGKHSWAWGINDVGQVVGYSTTAEPAEYHAFLWQNDVMRDLNDLVPAGSGWTLGFAEAINNSGQIVGQGQYNGEAHAFLLTPIPEPSTILTILFGLGGVVWRRKR